MQDDTTDRIPDVDPTVPSVARMYDYFLGGEHHYEVDEYYANVIRSATPEVHDSAHTNRVFLRRSVRWMVNAGIEQFLDIGSGLPTVDNTHEVAQKIDPKVRVVYADNDPSCALHSQHLLSTSNVVNVRFVDADFLDPDDLLSRPEVGEMIDFTKPVGVLMVGLMHVIADSHNPKALIARYMEAVPSGSYLSFSQLTKDDQSPDAVAAFYKAASAAGTEAAFRTRDEIRDFFEGLELVPPYEGDDSPPDLVWSNQWGTANPEKADRAGSWLWAGIGRKP